MDAVNLDETGVTYTGRDGRAQRIEWPDVAAVEIITTDEGPA
jgi:hypothetical protein